MSEPQSLIHEFLPVANENSQILILGTFPSVKSRELAFYYSHPQNRFWKILAALNNSPVPHSIAAKKQFLLEHKIAIWDVIKSCDIVGSADSSIKNVVAADIATLLKTCPIKKIYGNGTKACQLYDKYTLPQTNMPIIKLPSTSPANAASSLEKLVNAWSVILS